MSTFGTVTCIFIAPTCTTTMITLKPYALNVQPYALNLVHLVLENKTQMRGFYFT